MFPLKNIITIYKNISTKAKAIWLSATLGLFLSLPVWAQDGLNGLENFDVNLGQKPLVEIVANIINIFLGVLGVIAVVIIMYGGYLWMTAKGNEEQLEKAKKLLIDGAIGLAIILMAWGIAAFIINRIRDATGGGGDDGPPIVCADGSQPPCTFLSRQFKVASVDPKDRANNVKLCASVQATFNDVVDQNTINSSNIKIWNTKGTDDLTDDVLVQNDNPPIIGTYSGVGNSFSFEHSARSASDLNEFSRNTKYRALISADVKSVSAKNLNKKKEWLFTTGVDSDRILPVVSEAYPIPNSEEVCRNTSIQVIFNEVMLATSLNLDNIILYQGATPVELTGIRVGSDFKSVTLYPKSALAARAQFTVKLRTSASAQANDGIRDSCSNPLDGNKDLDADYTPTDDYSWSFKTGETTDCAPSLSSVNPAAGDYGDTVTLVGKNFALTGEVEFHDVIADDNSFDGLKNILCWNKAACPDQIKVRVPVGARSGLVRAAVGRDYSNGLPFTVTSPYIDSLSPEAGGKDQYVTISGENFGDDVGVVRFGSSIDGAPPACADYWSDHEIVIKVPVGFMPEVSAPVQVITSTAKKSNFADFTVTNDTPGPGLCSVSPNRDNVSKPVTLSGEHFGVVKGNSKVLFEKVEASVEAAGWSQTTIPTAYVPQISSGGKGVGVVVASKESNRVTFQVLNGPSVVEQATCVSSMQSPTPYKSSAEVCKNASLGARFNKVMKEDSLTAPNNLELKKCNNDDEFSASDCSGVVNLGAATIIKDGDDNSIGFTKVPAADLDNGFWYQATVSGSVVKELGGAPLGSDYVWHFKVRSQDENCAINKVRVNPSTAYIRSEFDTQNYTAQADAQNCNVLNQVEGWSWESDNPNKATITPNYPGAPRAVADDNGVNWEADESVGPIKITAKFNDKDDDGDLYISSTACSENADCGLCGAGRSSCTKSRCTPVIDNFTPNNGAVGTWVSINGCYFGNKKGQVFYTNSIEGLWPDSNLCGKSTWGNTQIISEVPPGIAAQGPISVVRPEASEDDIANSSGDFTKNTVARPGICRVEPRQVFSKDLTDQEKARVTIFGKLLDGSRGQNFVEYDLRILNNKLQINGQAVSYTSWADTMIEAITPNTNTIAPSDVLRIIKKPVPAELIALGINELNSNTLEYRIIKSSLGGENKLPVIDSINPPDGRADGTATTVVTIKGSNFGTTGQVWFDNKLADFAKCGTWTDKEIIIAVPTTLLKADNKVKVKTEGGTSNDDKIFRVSSVIRPGICSISPAFGKEGAEVSISGYNFTSNQARGSMVTVACSTDDLVAGCADTVEEENDGSGGVQIENDRFVLKNKISSTIKSGIVNWDNNKITVKLPPKVRTGDVRVSADYMTVPAGGLRRSNPITFTGAPFINRITPDKASAGSFITIEGGNFSDCTTRGTDLEDPCVVSFGKNNNDREPAAPLPAMCLWSDSFIVTKVPDKAADEKSQLVKVRTLNWPSVGILETTDKDSKPFTRDESVPKAPGLCALSPSQVNEDALPKQVSLYGNRFGATAILYPNPPTKPDPKDYSKHDQVKFTNLSYLEINTAVWGSNWSDQKIEVNIPENTKSGLVSVQKTIDQVTNRTCSGAQLGEFCLPIGWSYKTEKKLTTSNPLPFKVSAGDLKIESFVPTNGSNDVCRNMAINVKTNQAVKSANFEETIKLVDETSLLIDSDFKDLVFKATPYTREIKNSYGKVTDTEYGLTISPRKIFDPSHNFKLTIKGGEGGIVAEDGGKLVCTNSSDCEITFTTGDRFCTIDKVEIDPANHNFIAAGENKIFEAKAYNLAWANPVGSTCPIGFDWNAESDFNKNGNWDPGECQQKIELANVDYAWSKVDPNQAIVDNLPKTTPATVTITSTAKEGMAKLIATGFSSTGSASPVGGECPVGSVWIDANNNNVKDTNECKLIDANWRSATGWADLLVLIGGSIDVSNPLPIDLNNISTNACRNGAITADLLERALPAGNWSGAITLEKNDNSPVVGTVSVSKNEDGGKISFIPGSPLDSNTQYRVKMNDGIFNCITLQDSVCNWLFTTSDKICTVAKVEVAPSKVDFTTSGQTASLTAKAYDADNKELLPAQVGFTWEKIDEKGIVKFNGGTISNTATVETLGRDGQAQAKVTGYFPVDSTGPDTKGKCPNATIWSDNDSDGTVDDQECKITSSQASATVPVNAFVCDAPWQISDPDYNFRLNYCRIKDKASVVNFMTVDNGTVESSKTFDGSIFIDLSKTKSFDLTKVVTMSTWIRPTDLSGTRYIISKWKDDKGYALRLKDSKLEILINDQILSATTVLLANTWYQLIGTFDGTNLKLYINGKEEVNKLGYNSAILINDSTPTIGASVDHTNYIKGDLDEVGIFNKALTPDQLKSLVLPYLTQITTTSAAAVNPVAGICPSGYDWVDKNNNKIIDMIVVVGDRECISTEREYLFPNSNNNKEAVGIRVYPNPERLSVAEWYKKRTDITKGNLSSIKIDGYDAGVDGTTTYVSALRRTGANNENIYSNIYVLTYPSTGGQLLKDIVKQLIDSWEFNTNFPTGADTKIEEKAKLFRDLTRLRDMAKIKGFLADYYQAKSDYIKIKGGSFVVGKTFSTWPSWQSVLGSELKQSLPVDPVNELKVNGVACVVGASNFNSCITDAVRELSCPSGPQVYSYSYDKGTTPPVNVDTNYEVKGITWKGRNPQEILINSACPVQKTVSVLISGAGTGEVVSTPAGIDCPDASCFKNDVIKNVDSWSLVATPSGSSIFSGWTQIVPGVGCTGSNTTCNLGKIMDDVIQGANFVKRVDYNVEKKNTTVGAVDHKIVGTVRVNSAVCDTGCASKNGYLPEESILQLVATPASGYVFTGWAGISPNKSISLTLTNPVNNITANFTPEYTLKVEPKPTKGLVTSALGVNCGSRAGQSACSKKIDPSATPSGTLTFNTSSLPAGYEFLGWTGGDCSGTGDCTLTFNNHKTVGTNVQIKTFDVTVTSSAGGTVTSNTGGIDCGATCVKAFDYGSTVTLTANPNSGYELTGWGGACSGNSITCIISNILEAKSVTASFAKKKYNFDLVITGGAGSVSFDPVTISPTCSSGATCQILNLTDGTNFVLTPTFDNTTFDISWSNCTPEAGNTCRVTMDDNKTVTLTLSPKAHKITITKQGGSDNGDATIASNPAGLNCAEGGALTCNIIYPFTSIPVVTNVILTASSASSNIGNWGGDCSGSGTVPCTLDVSIATGSNKTVSLQLTRKKYNFTLNINNNSGATGKVSYKGTDYTTTGSPHAFANILHGEVITLTATPDGTNRIGSWSGDCSSAGQNANCSITLNSDKTANISFVPGTYNVSVHGQTGAQGNGTVTSAPAGINCSISGLGEGGNCSEDYPASSSVTLTAVANLDSGFMGWADGPCVESTDPCIINSLNINTSMTAWFKLKPVITVSNPSVSWTTSDTINVSVVNGGSPTYWVLSSSGNCPSETYTNAVSGGLVTINSASIPKSTNDYMCFKNTNSDGLIGYGVTSTVLKVDNDKPAQPTIAVTPTTAYGATTSVEISLDAIATDSHSGVKEIELWRAPYNATNCKEGPPAVKTGCNWGGARIKTFTNITDISTTNVPGLGTWVYGIHVVDWAGNYSTEVGIKEVKVLTPIAPKINSFSLSNITKDSVDITANISANGSSTGIKLVLSGPNPGDKTGVNCSSFDSNNRSWWQLTTPNNITADKQNQQVTYRYVAGQGHLQSPEMTPVLSSNTTYYICLLVSNGFTPTFPNTMTNANKFKTCQANGTCP